MKELELILLILALLCLFITILLFASAIIASEADAEIGGKSEIGQEPASSWLITALLGFSGLSGIIVLIRFIDRVLKKELSQDASLVLKRSGISLLFTAIFALAWWWLNSLGN